MAKSPENDTAAARERRLQKPAAAPSQALPHTLLVPLPEEALAGLAEAPPAAPPAAAPPLEAARARPPPPPSPARPSGPRLERVPTATIRPMTVLPEERPDPV